MCGIAGYAQITESNLIDRMLEKIVHRGPDHYDSWVSGSDPISIGMCRLSIIDLVGGNQPVSSDCDKVKLVFNGEIYNYREIRDELVSLGQKFKTNSDAEVILRAYLAWGDDAWKIFKGMFAIAIVDSRYERSILKIIRDHVGIKPLYYLYQDNKLIFASEIKAILAWQDYRKQINCNAINDYLALRYVPGEQTLFHGIKKLSAGCQLTFDMRQLRIDKWWQPPSTNQVLSNNFSDSVDIFTNAMRSSIRRHLVSDVPVGAFLSGGVDSNVIVALMAAETSQKIQTFSIGFEQFSKDEIARAALTANYFGTSHNEIICEQSDFARLDDIAYSLDEPIGDAIVIPMYRLAAEASKQVKVVLSGEGADEILGGYFFHRKLVQMQKLRNILPNVGISLIHKFVALIPATCLDLLFKYPGALGHAGKQRLLDLLDLLRQGDLATLYRQAIALIGSNEILNLAACSELATSSNTGFNDYDLLNNKNSSLQRLVHMQYRDWLPDDILMKLDKMTMAHSLEGRVPFLDPDVIQASYSMPDQHKLSSRTDKRVLRALATKILPDEIAGAPKAAFYIPLESYIKSPKLQEMLNYFLNSERIEKRGLIKSKWLNDNLIKTSDHGFLPLKKVFSILMLEVWFEQFAPDASWQ